MTAATITMISIAYSNLIQHFPGGGGGYLVATKLLGSRLGVISGCALLVDYVLTITVSVASGCDQLWSCLPTGWLPYKLPAEFVVLAMLVILNLRGVKESVRILAPVFLLFVVTHAFMIVYAIVAHTPELPGVFSDAASELHASVNRWPLPRDLIPLRAYSLGGGTYTGSKPFRTACPCSVSLACKREADHGDHGLLSRVHGRRDPLRLPPDGFDSRVGPHDECRAADESLRGVARR
jgi:amino acid transporter